MKHKYNKAAWYFTQEFLKRNNEVVKSRCKVKIFIFIIMEYFFPRYFLKGRMEKNVIN